MDENTKEKKNDREYNKAVLNSMTKLVEEKINACKTGLPLVLTIVTPLIAFLFAESYPSKSMLWVAIIALVFLLVAFIALLLASFPKTTYKEKGKSFLGKAKTIPFNPINVKSFQNLSNEQFLKDLQQYLDCDFTETEKLQADALKEKINEYRTKKNLLKLAYGVLIVGAILLIVIFYAGLFVL